MFTLDTPGLPVHHALADVDPVKIATTGVNIGGSVLSSAVGAGVLSIGIPAAAAVPVIGVAVLGVTYALNAIFNRPTQRYKVITTDIVNQLEPQLKANEEAYFAGPRTVDSQKQALANFDAAWAYLISDQACGNKQLDFPGENCIKDRNRGGQWDWFSYYRDPIAQDTMPAQQAAASAASADPITAVISALSPNSTSTTSANPNYAPYLVAAAIVAVILIL